MGSAVSLPLFVLGAGSGSHWVAGALSNALAGLLAGLALGALGLWLTRFEPGESQLHYTPNPWIGGVLSVLLLGRLAWRWSQGALVGGGAHAAQQASPLTMGIAAALIAYSLVYSVGLLLRMRQLALPQPPPR